MTMVPDFIKKLTVSTSADVFAFSGRGGRIYLPSSTSKVVNAGSQAPAEGYVVLAQLSKGVKSNEDGLQASTLFLGTSASVLVLEPEPLTIGVGGGLVESVNVIVPRFTRFTSNSKWG
mgnify:CR=1 FL=1